MNRTMLFLLLPLAAVACQDQGPTVPAHNPQFAQVGSRPVYRVSGGGSVVRVDPSGTRRSVYAFNATLDPTGSASGQAEVHFTSTPAHIHIDVQCLVVRGNEAWLSGPVTRTDNPYFYLGAVFLWRVQDNGEGGSAAPDRISAFVWKPQQNYPPAACLWQPESMAMDPWTNGNVQILGDNEDFSLADMYGTWDATLMRYTWLRDPNRTIDMGTLGGRMRMTVAPDGDFSMVWWFPGEIIENTVGRMEVVNGEALIITPEDPGVVQVVRLWHVGSAVWIEGDQMGPDFNGDGQDDWSHLIALVRPKTTGTLIGDVAGTWDAVRWRYTSASDPTEVVELVTAGVAITMTVGLAGQYAIVFDPGWANTGNLLFESSDLLVRAESRESSPELRWPEADASRAFTFGLDGGTWSFTGPDTYDFDGNGTPDPATLDVVLARR